MFDAVSAVYIIKDFGLHKEYHIIVSQLNRPDFMQQSKAVAIPDIIFPEVQPRGAVWSES